MPSSRRRRRWRCCLCRGPPSTRLRRRLMVSTVCACASMCQRVRVQVRCFHRRRRRVRLATGACWQARARSHSHRGRRVRPRKRSHSHLGSNNQRSSSNRHIRHNRRVSCMSLCRCAHACTAVAVVTGSVAGALHLVYSDTQSHPIPLIAAASRRSRRERPASCAAVAGERVDALQRRMYVRVRVSSFDVCACTRLTLLQPCRRCPLQSEPAW
jgi:hypothetical protein